MLRRLFLLLIVMSWILAAQAEARCRRPPLEATGIDGYSAIPPPGESGSDVALLAQVSPDEPIGPAVGKAAVASGEEGARGKLTASGQSQGSAAQPAKSVAAKRVQPEAATQLSNASQAGSTAATGGSASSDADGQIASAEAQPDPAENLAVATPAPAPGPTLAPSPDVAAYKVSAGETLRTALTRWTAGSGWELVWDAPNDYSISAPAEFIGAIPHAVTQLMESLRGNGAPFGADIWEGNRVIRVTRNR